MEVPAARTSASGNNPSSTPTNMTDQATLSSSILAATTSGDLPTLKTLLTPSPTETLHTTNPTLSHLAALAASNHHLPTLSHLLTLGANPKDWDLYTAVLDQHSQELYATVLPHGFDLNLDTDNLVGGPLQWSINASDFPLFTYLIENGADVNMDVQARKYTPLATAARKGNLDMMQVLVAKGADVDRSGAVVVAAREGRLEVVRWLVDVKGADVDRVDGVVLFLVGGRRETALCAAVREGKGEVVEFLVGRRVGLGGRDWQGKTPAEIAGERGEEWLVALLRDDAREVHGA